MWKHECADAKRIDGMGKIPLGFIREPMGRLGLSSGTLHLGEQHARERYR